MKKKDIEKMRNKSVSELEKEVATRSESLWETLRDIKSGTLKNVRAARMLRKDIARIKTFIKEKKEAVTS